MVRALVVDLQPERAGTVAVREEELRLVVRVALRREPADDLERLVDEHLAVLLRRALVGVGRADVLRRVDKVFGVEEVRLRVWIGLDALAILVDVLFREWRGT